MKARIERTRPEGCLSDLHLDGWVAGELSDSELSRADAHADACERCHARRREWRAAQEGFLASYPPPPAKPTSLGALRRRVALGVPLAAALAIAAAFMLMSRPSQPESYGERSKGGARIGYFLKRGERVMRGNAGDVVLAGDRLRLTYTIDEPRYLGVLGLDGTGRAAVYFPATGKAERVAAGSDRALPISIEFDDAAGDEQISALFCAQAKELGPLRDELARTGQLTVPDHCSLDRIVLTKGRR